MPFPGKPNAVPSLLSPEEAAEALGVSTKTIRRMIAAQQLPASRIGRQLRIAPGDLTAFINRGRTTVSM